MFRGGPVPAEERAVSPSVQDDGAVSAPIDLTELMRPQPAPERRPPAADLMLTAEEIRRHFCWSGEQFDTAMSLGFPSPDLTTIGGSLMTSRIECKWTESSVRHWADQISSLNLG
jgi:hypothetical protein